MPTTNAGQTRGQAGALLPSASRSDAITKGSSTHESSLEKAQSLSNSSAEQQRLASTTQNKEQRGVENKTSSSYVLKAWMRQSSTNEPWHDLAIRRNDSGK